MSIASGDGGMAYHARTLREGRFAGAFDRLIPLRSLGEADLGAHRALLIPCRTHGERLATLRDVLAAYMRGGGTLVVLGETRPDLFLDGVTLRVVPTNYWWWLEAEGRLDVRVVDRAHPLLREVDEADLRWHVHGTHDVEGGRELVRYEDREEGGAVMVEASRGAGRLLVTTLDPVYHHGSGFMPATTRFLEVFVPWLAGL